MKPIRIADKLGRVQGDPQLECSENLSVDRPNWGRQVTVGPGGNPALLQWQVPSLGAESVALVFSVTGIRFDADGMGALIGTAPIVVDLTWGVGATVHQATVDVSNGTVVQLVASSVSANVRMLESDDVANNAIVHASLVFGDAPAAAQPTLTGASIELAQNDETDIAIPAFARGFVLYTDDATFFDTGAAIITVVNSPGLLEIVYVLDGADVEVALLQSDVGLPLPGHARNIHVQWTGLNTIHITPMFFLHL